MVFQSVSKLVEWSMKRALHVFLFIYVIIPIFGTLFLPFPLLLEVQMSLQWMIFWHHLRLFLEDETPNGDFSIDGEHGQYAVGVDIVRLPNQGRHEGDLFLTGHDVAPLDCYAGNNRVQMKIPRVLCADGICVFYAQFVVGIPCLHVMHACMAIWNISSSIFSRTHHSYPFHNSYSPYSHENISPFSHHLHIYIPITHIICSTASRFISLMPHAPPLTTISCIPISHWPFPSHHLSLTSSFHITHPMHAPIAIKPIASYPFSSPSHFLSVDPQFCPFNTCL